MENKPIMASVDRRLSRKDVVERGRLDLRTARYVMEKVGEAGRPGRLDIPEADGRGEHRRFNVDEAGRIVLCTRLVMLGLPFDVAERTTVACEQYWRGLVRGEDVRHLFDGRVTNPWRIKLVNNCKFVRVWRDKPDPRNSSEMLTKDYYHSAGDWKRVADLNVPPGLPVIKWSLTHAAADLAGDQ